MRRFLVAMAAAGVMSWSAAPASAQTGYVGDCFYYTPTMYECSGRDRHGNRYRADGWRSSIGDDITIRSESPSGYGERTNIWLAPWEDSARRNGWEVRRCTQPYGLDC